MNIKDTDVKFQNALDNRRLVIDRTTLDLETWRKLFEEIFVTPQMIFEDATVTSSSSQIIVNGKSTILGVDRADITMMFVETCDRLEVSLRTTIPDSWSLFQGFADIKDSYFDTLEFSDSILEISSFQDVQGEILQIITTATLPDLNSAGMELRILPQAQVFSLTSAEPSNWDLPAIPFFSIIDSRLTLETILPMQVMRGEITATLRVNEQLAIPTRIELPASDEGWLFAANFEIVPIPSLADVTQLVGGDDLVNTLPAPLQEVGSFAFSDLQVMFDPESQNLAYISLDIVSKGEWAVIPGLLSVSNFLLSTKVQHPLDSTSRAIKGEIGGILKLASAEIEVRAYLPNFAFYGDLFPDSKIALREILSYFSIDSDEIPNVAISELSLLLESQTQSCGFHIRIVDLWQMTLGQVDIALQDLIVDFDYVGGRATGSIRGSSTIAGSKIVLAAELGDRLVLAGSISYIDLSAIIQALIGDIALPEELPKVQFSDIDIAVTPTTGAFFLRGTTNIDWDFNTGGQKINTQVDLILNRTVSSTGASTIDCKIALKGEGLLSIADELLLKRFSFDFNLDGNQDWSLSGGVTTALFENELELAAEYRQIEGKKSLTLATIVATPTELVSLAGVADLNASRLTIAMAKQTVDEQTLYTWDVSASGRVKVEGVFDFGGNLTLYQKADKTAGLNFLPTSATVSLPLAVPPQNGRQASINLEVGPISIIRKVGTDNQSADWFFESSVALAFKDLPKGIQNLLPDRIRTQFKADKEAVSLTVDRVMETIALPIPDIEIDRNTRIPLGTAALDASNLSILFSTNVELSAELGLVLPADLNKVFGVKEDGNPAMDFFKVYKADDRNNTLVRLRLSVGTEGVKINPLSSPIEAIRLREENGTAWCDCNFGEFGQMKFQVPEFSLDTTTSSFTAKGGFETVEPLKLPLTPFKTLLTATDLKDVADSLPNSLPLKAISILDAQNNFKVNELINLFQGMGITIPPEVNQILATIADKADQLPDRFKHYLNIEIPDSFLFDIAITPDGGARINVGVKEGDPPVKLLTVGMNGPVPVLTGIELRSFSFGEVLGGTLFLMEVDARFDQFDLATLASSLLLPQDGSLSLPASRELHRRLIVDKLFMIIVYQTGVPIPVPLFFDRLGIEYLSLTGVALQSNASLPMPKINLMDIGRSLAKIKRFFTDRNYLLDPLDPPQDMNLTFSLGKNYIQLPKYLGHEVAGSQTDLLKVDTYEYTARLLNGLKTLSLNDLVQALPLEYRVGTSSISLACLTANATWLLTTPDEFREIAYQRLNIPTGEISNALAVLPPSGSTRDEQGLVTFLQGSWEVPNLANFETMFGLIASGSMGFQTGFKIAGTIANFMDMELSGRVAINAPKPSPSSSTQTRSYALTFDGQSTPVNCGDRIHLANSTFTIELWVKRDVINHHHFAIDRGTGGINQRLHIGFRSNNSFTFGFTGNDLNTPAYTDTNWHHWACVYNSKTRQRVIYRDGTEVAKDVATASYQGTGDLFIGQAFGFPFNGQIDEVRVWNQVRSEAEIRANMNAQLNGNELGLIGYWSLDEGSGNIAHDKTARANHGTLQGTRWVQSSLQLSSPSQQRSTSAVSVATDSVVQLAGHSHLTVLDRQIFLGDLQIVDNRFQLNGKFDLFPANFPFIARGNLEGWLNETELYLAGDIEVSLGNIMLIGAKGIVTNDRITLQGTWLGVSTILDVENQDGALALRGAVALDLFGLRAAAALTIDSHSGAVVRGKLDAVDLGIFKLTGVGGQPHPSFDLQLQGGQVSRMDVVGAVELLGLRSETQIAVSETSFAFSTRGQIFNRFESSLEVMGGRINEPRGFRVVATLQNNFFQYLKEEATKVISQAASAATSELANAQREVANAQRKVDRLNADIAYWRKVVEGERAYNQGKLRDAQQNVSNEQRKVNNLLNQIRQKKEEFERLGRDGYHGFLGIWYLYPSAIHRRSALLAEIPALHIAHGTATGALEIAKASLILVEGAMDTTPIDLDPRISRLFIARDTATAALTVAQETLRVLRNGIGAIATIGEFIVRMGANSVLEVRSARFEAELSQISGGQVLMALDLKFMNENRNISFDFNFNDPLGSSKALGQFLLPS